MKKKLPVPSEHSDQAALFRWLSQIAVIYKIPGLLLSYAVPNAAKRGKRLAAYMKAEGMKAGVPDVCIPVPAKGYHGLYIEMKREDGGDGPTDDQKHYIDSLNQLGYLAAQCNGYDAARRVVMDYFGIYDMWP
jgi:hypothetical protein